MGRHPSNALHWQNQARSLEAGLSWRCQGKDLRSLILREKWKYWLWHNQCRLPGLPLQFSSFHSAQLAAQRRFGHCPFRIQYRLHSIQWVWGCMLRTNGVSYSFKRSLRTEILKGLHGGWVTVICRQKGAGRSGVCMCWERQHLSVAYLWSHAETIPIRTESRTRGRKETCWLDKAGKGTEPGRETETALGTRKPGQVSEGTSEAVIPETAGEEMKLV